MLSKLSANFLLIAVLSFFIFIIVVLVLGSITKPARWGKRTRLVGRV